MTAERPNARSASRSYAAEALRARAAAHLAAAAVGDPDRTLVIRAKRLQRMAVDLEAQARGH